jgi:hypothetical protein
VARLFLRPDPEFADESVNFWLVGAAQKEDI